MASCCAGLLVAWQVGWAASVNQFEFTRFFFGSRQHNNPGYSINKQTKLPFKENKVVVKKETLIIKAELIGRSSFTKFI